MCDVYSIAMAFSRASVAALLLAAGCCSLPWSVAAQGEELLVKELSFAAPFEVFDVGGTRNVHGYRHGGHADVKKNFVRLTSSREV